MVLVDIRRLTLFAYRTLTLCRLPSHAIRLSIRPLMISGSSPFARRYSENRFFFLFLRVLRWFSSPRSLTYTMCSYTHDGTSAAGLPHSEICALSLICSYAQLIAACHVLHRLPMPRHSPYALFSFSSFSFLRFSYLRLLYSRRIFVFPYAIFNQLSAGKPADTSVFFSQRLPNRYHFFK